MSWFKKKSVIKIYDEKISRLNEIEEYLNSWKGSLFLGGDLPDDLKSFKSDLISKIKYKRARLEEQFSAVIYTEKRAEFVSLEKQILDM